MWWRLKLNQSKQRWMIHANDGDQQRLEITGPASQVQTSHYHCWGNSGRIYCLYCRISITLVQTQLMPKVTLHNFFCNQNLFFFTIITSSTIWLRGDSDTSNLLSGSDCTMLDVPTVFFPTKLPSNWLKWLQKSWDQVSWEAQLPLKLSHQLRQIALLAVLKMWPLA